jgi:hypothetical protein
MLTLHDLCEKLKQIDEVSLMEILEISSEDMVLKFIDKIEDKYDYLVGEFEGDADFDVDPATPESWERQYWEEGSND